jgi:hypothetical protein
MAMKGVIGKFVAVLGCAGALAGSNGCYSYRDVVDPCYPQRYWYASRQNVHEAFAPQVRNGHVLDQTVWNYHFEDGTARLTLGGREHLAYLARRRPTADPMIFLQTAQDVPYDATKSEEFAAKRKELDQSRVAAVKQFLEVATRGSAVPHFEVLVHNPPEVGLGGEPAGVALRAMNTTGSAVLPRGLGISGAGGAGAGVVGIGGAGTTGGSGTPGGR